MMTSSMSDCNRVVVSPSFPLEWRDVDDFLGEFGPFNGRYVPRYPNDWLERLRHHLADIDSHHLPPRERAALFERLRREIMLCTTPVGWSWDDSKSWGRNVQDVLDVAPYAKVVGDALDPSPYKNWAHVAGDIKRSRFRTWNFHGLVSEYVNRCAPLLVNSPAAYMIDPYLDPFSDACENLLLSFFDLIKGSKCYRLELITRQSACGRELSGPETRMNKSEIESSLKRIYGQRIPKDRSLVTHLVHDVSLSEEGLTMHDRFFMTNYGAINFGQGFLVVSQKQPMQNAFVVDRDHHARLKEVYINGVARYFEKLPRVLNVAYPKGVTSIELQG
jgi:hypothetical protein